MHAAARRIWIQMTADRRRFGLLCVVGAVGLLLWARMIIVANMPRTAIAGPQAGGAEHGEDGLSGFAADKSGTIEGKSRPLAAREALAIVLDRRAGRDPFVISRAHFPRPKLSSSLNVEAGKLPTEPAEDSYHKEARLVARVSELLGAVRLEAAMGGVMAVIDGKAYRLGERLPPMGSERIELTLAQVRQRSVVLAYQGRRFELEMSTPGNK
jgi:hypothetical protein